MQRDKAEFELEAFLMARIHKILCPVDFFPAAARAVDYAIALARKNKASFSLREELLAIA
jgi:hypothetical protein